MYCKNCGKEIGEEARFCPDCGTDQQSEVEQPYTATEAPEATDEVVEKKPAKVWTVFSKLSKIFGIVSISTSLIPYLNLFSGLMLGIVGIVFGCLGRRAKTEITDKNSKLGLKLSIAGVVVSAVMYVLFIVIMVAVYGAVIFGSMAEGFYY